MTDLATRIADARKKVDDSLSQWTSGLPISRSLFIEMADEIDRLKAQLEKAREAIRHAYNEGFSEGMREHTSRRGGKTWAESTAARVHAELAEKEKE